jgi:hypothetical protein
MDLLAEHSTETIDIDLSTDGEILLVPTTKPLLESSPRWQLKSVDFDPFVDGEILLTAPATESQQEIWVGVQISDEANLACLLSQSLRLTGELNLHALEMAFRQLAMKH